MTSLSITPYTGERFDPRRGGHVESYFVKANDPSGRRAIWVRATICAMNRSPERAVAEAWAIAFDREGEHVAVKTQVPYEEARFAKDHVRAEVSGCLIRESASQGVIETAGRTIDWDLRLEDRGGALVHFPASWMYEGPLPSSKLVSPGLDLRISGRVRVRGTGERQEWKLDAWPGLLGHNWGRKNAHFYGWGHCNAWEGEGDHEGLVIEGVTAQVKLGPVLTPRMTVVCVRHRGARYELNAITDVVRNEGEVTPRRWRFKGAHADFKITGEFWGETDDFVGLHYLNPDGTMTYCLNTKLAHARLELEVKGEPKVTARSRAAALEIGTRDPHHGVRMRV